jgi:hypothetical protein
VHPLDAEAGAIFPPFRKKSFKVANLPIRVQDSWYGDFGNFHAKLEETMPEFHCQR